MNNNTTTGLVKLHDPANGPMRTVILMSGSGTNAEMLLKYQLQQEAIHGSCAFDIVALVSDKPESRAKEIAETFSRESVIYSYSDFCKNHKVEFSNMHARGIFERRIVDALQQFDITAAAYAGYMLKATSYLVKKFIGSNVHPAKLTLLDATGKPLYTGAQAVRAAILAGEKYLHSSTHLIDEKVDEGGVIMVSQPVTVNLPEYFDPKNESLVEKVVDDHQTLLKHVGDHVIFPATLEFIATGRITQDPSGLLYYDEKPIPNGIVMSKH